MSGRKSVTQKEKKQKSNVQKAKKQEMTARRERTVNSNEGGNCKKRDLRCIKRKECPALGKERKRWLK